MARTDVRVGVNGFKNKPAEERRIPKITYISDEDKRKCADDWKREEQFLMAFPRMLPNALDAIIREYRINVSVLAEDSDLSEKTIERIRTRIDYKPTLPTMIQLCIGLRVSTVICLTLIEVAGYRFGYTGIDLAYYHIITQKVGCTLPVCNEYLISMGYPPLGRIENAA